MNEPLRVDPSDRELIIGTMRSWARGEPVWPMMEILERWGFDFLMYRIAWDMQKDFKMPGPARDRNLHQLRDEAINEFGFSLPSKELLDVLEEHQPIVEIGAGTGYMTRLMRNRGIEVIGTDIGFGQRFACGTFDQYQLRIPGKTAVRRFRDHTVFCAWPSLWETWFRQALRAMQVGQKLVVIEEDACAEDSAWDYRDQSFVKIGDNNIPLPAWPLLNDRASAWVKLRHTSMRPLTREQETDRREAGWNRFKQIRRDPDE